MHFKNISDMIPRFKLSVYVLFFIYFSVITTVICKPHLILNNNGPAVLGANITFSSLLLDYSAESALTYTFTDGVQTEVIKFPSGPLNVSLSRRFSSDQYVEGSYCMNVTVEAPEVFIFEKTIAANFTCFNLQRYLIGEILVYQGNRSMDEDVKIAIEENFTVAVDLYDPNNYLKDAKVDYSWSFDMDRHFTYNNSLTYNFTDVGSKLIVVKATATFPNSLTKSGFFTKNVIAEVPVKNVNISGDLFLRHGDFLKLNISWSGTPPYAYCSEILRDNTTISNFTCSQIFKLTTCHMKMKRFLTDGKYQLGIYVGNDVREVKKIYEIIVYNVSIKPTLSTIIIPIVCSLLTLIIIAIGISYYIQQRNRLAVEVADFDFLEESDSYTGERTFFEKIFDSFACRNCGQNRLPCVNNRSESDPLLDDEDPLPYV